ncbi:hypothetical protein [Agromyces cerinus]|uniref:hypothetical protein n=1 Tax=Agromyces cerinus TaxID=33878 RepID=UPI000941211D|nr:hypothetical protein [Agromyces cerinus]
MALGLAAAFVFSSCSLLNSPPQSVRWAADSMVDQFNALDGVTEVSTEYSSFEKGPTEMTPRRERVWSVRITVDVEEDLPVAAEAGEHGALSAIATEIERAIEEGADLTAAVTLQIPADDDGAPASLVLEGMEDCLEFSTPAEMAGAVSQLRGVDGVGVLVSSESVSTASAVTLSQSDPTAVVDVTDSSEVDEVVARIEELPGFGTGPLSTVEVRTRSSAEAPVALKRINGENVVFPITTDCTGEAPEGDDAGLDAAPAAPLVLDAASADGRVAEDRAAVTSFLDDAGDAAGIRGVTDVGIAMCETGVGEQVQGTAVIPIFEIADSADDGYEAVTAVWTAAGFTRTDRASGTDFFAAADPQALGAVEVTIRGTADGIVIRASSACVVTG